MLLGSIQSLIKFMTNIINPLNTNNLQNDEIDFSKIINIIIRNKRLFIIIVSIFTSLSLTYNFFKRPIFKGNFDIVVKNENDSANNPLSLLNPLNESKTNDTQKLILSSPSVLLPVFESVKDYYKRKGYSTLDLEFDKWVQEELRINFEKGTNVLKVSAFSNDKELIIYTLKNISSQYKKYSQEVKIADMKKSIIFLETEKKKLERKAIESQKKYNQFSIENGLGPIDGIISLGDKTELFSLSEVNQKDKNSLNVFQSNLNNKKAGQRFTDQFKLLKSFEAQYTVLSAKLKPKSKTLIELKKSIENLKEYLKRPNEILIQYGILKEKASRDTSLLYATERELAIAELNLNNTPSAWEMISSPTIERKPASPKIVKNTALSFFISIFFAIIAVLLKDRKDDLIFDNLQIENILDLAYLETIYKNNQEVNTLILQSIISKKNLSDKKIGIILFDKSENNSSNNQIIFKDSKNITYTNLLDDETLKTLDSIIFIFEFGKFNSDDLGYIKNFTFKLNTKVIGWFLVRENEEFNNKNLSNMMNLNIG